MNVAVLTEILAAVISYCFVFPEYGLLWAVVAFVLVKLCGFVGFVSFMLVTMEGGSRLSAAVLGLVFLLSVYFGGGFVLDLETNRFPEHGLVVSRSGWRHSDFESDQLGMEVIAYYERGNSKLLLFLDETSWSLFQIPPQQLK